MATTQTTQLQTTPGTTPVVTFYPPTTSPNPGQACKNNTFYEHFFRIFFREKIMNRPQKGYIFRDCCDAVFIGRTHFSTNLGV